MDDDTSDPDSDSIALVPSDAVQTLTRAMEMGYFEVPRETTLTEVAESLGRSDVTVARDLRRGMVALLRWTEVIETAPVRTNGTTDRSQNRSLAVLAHPYRRRILQLISEHNPRDEEEFAVEDDDLELLTTELYRAHLPKLAEAGYVDWDRDTKTIRRGPNFEEVAPLLRLMTEHEDELPKGWP
jgi:hypothetical protein